MTRMALGMMS